MPETMTYTGACHVRFAVPQDLYDELQANTRRYFWCPRGCELHFTESKTARLERELAAARRRPLTRRPPMPMVDRYFEALARRVTQGRIPSTRDPLPLRSLAELLADVADEVTGQMTAEAEGTRLIVGVLVARLGGDVTITGEELMDVSHDFESEVTDESVRLRTT